MKRSRLPARLLPLLATSLLIPALPVLAPLRVAAQTDQAADAAPHTWQFQYKLGQTAKYRVTTALTGQLPNGDMLAIEDKGLINQAIRSLSDNGDATLVMTIEKNDLKINGQAIPPDPATYPIITDTLSTKGILVKHEVKNGQPGTEQLNQVASFVNNTPAPAQPVKIGDTWKTELDNPMVQGKKVTMTSTLLGTEKVSGIDTLKVKVQATVPTSADAGDQDSAKVDGVYYVDPQAGRLVRSQYTVDNVPLMGPGGTIKVKITNSTDLIVPGVNDKEEAPAPNQPAK